MLEIVAAICLLIVTMTVVFVGGFYVLMKIWNNEI